MYPNVRVILARKKWSILDLSEKCGIRYQTLTLKLKGESELTLAEALSIKKALGTDLSIEELFETDQDPDQGEP